MARTILLVFAALLLMSAAALAGDSVEVSVTVEGFRNEDGSCRLLLFDSEEGFPDSRGRAVAELSAVIRGGEAVFIFRVRLGRYAIAILHDENSDGKMDKTWYGKPKEGFGASRNPKIGLGPPGFDESALILDEQHNHSRIMLNYL